jgi:hypothetical protein
MEMKLVERSEKKIGTVRSVGKGQGDTELPGFHNHFDCAAMVETVAWSVVDALDGAGAFFDNFSNRLTRFETGIQPWNVFLPRPLSRLFKVVLVLHQRLAWGKWLCKAVAAVDMTNLVETLFNQARCAYCKDERSSRRAAIGYAELPRSPRAPLLAKITGDDWAICFHSNASPQIRGPPGVLLKPK